MAFCKNCGAQIPDGTFQCANCAQQRASAPQAAAYPPPFGTPAPMGGGFAPGGQPATNKSSKTGLAVLAVAVVAIIAVIVVLCTGIFSGYKKPLKNIEKAMNKGDANLLYESFMPEDILDGYKKIVKKAGLDWDDLCDETMGDSDDLKCTIKIKSKKKADKDAREGVEDTYNKMVQMINLAGADVDEVKVEKCYKLKVKITTKSNGDKNTKNETCYVAKLKGDSNWYFAPYGNNEFNNLFD